MLWLIPYVGWTLAASAVASAAGYAAVTQFSVIQRVLALALQRALSKLAKSEDGTSTYNVEHTGTGVIATGVVVARAALAAAQFSGTRIASLSIQRLEVDFPSLSSPVTVRVHGVRACMQQLQLPEHLSPEVRAAADRAANREEKRRRLEVVEGLLWGPSDSSSSKASTARRSWNPAGAYLGRLQARALQKSLAFVAQLLIVEITDVEVHYTQKGEPGPRPSANYLQGADAAVLHVRELSLMPHMDAVHRSTGVDDVEDGEGASSETTTPLGSPRKTAAAAASDEPTWWAALGSLPHLLWSNVVIARPSATKLSVTGVSLTLKTYPMLWQGYQAARNAAGVDQQGAAAAGPFAFTSPKLQSPGNKRRRRGAIIERLDAVGGSEDDGSAQPSSSRPGSASASPAKAGGGGGASTSSLQSPAKKTTTKTKTTTEGQSTTTMDESWIDYADALRATPAEEHVIFRQWEFSVMLCLLPPGYETMETSTLAPAPAPAPVQQPAVSPFSNAGTPGGNSQGPGTNEQGEPTQVQSVDSLPSRRPSLGRSISGFGSTQNLDGDGDVHHLQHIISGGFEDFDADPRGDLGLDTLDSSGTFASLRSNSGRLQRAGSSLIEINVDEEGGDNSAYGTPTTSLAASRGSSRNSSPERRPSLTKLAAAAAAAAVSAVDGGAGGTNAVAGGMNGSSAAVNGNRKHAPPPLSPSSGETSASAEAAPTAGGAQQKTSSSPTKTSSSPSKQPRSAHDSNPTTNTTTSTGSAARAAFTIDFAVTLKALILDMNAGSVAIVNRLLDRELHFSHFGDHWAVRPEVPVSGHEAQWWQHGGRALASCTRRLARREVPLGRLELRRAARMEYQSLYAGTHVNHRQFAEPGRRWWQMRRVRAADEAARRRLEEFEEALSLEELAHFRFGVAAIYNQVIAEDEALLHLVADKIDALVYTRRGGMPPGLADLLLHRDRKASSSSSSGGANGNGDSSSGLLRHGLRVSINCPKIGVALDMRPSSTAPSQPGLKYLVLCVKRVVGELDVDGSINLQVRSLDCGQSDAPTGTLEPVILACPSSVCAQICRAADFTRYAVTGDVLADSGLESQDMCARVSITPRYGTGGVSVVDAEGEAGTGGGLGTSINSTSGTGTADQSVPVNDDEWRPAGFNIDVTLAAVGLTYNGTVATKLLDVVSSWDACRTKPWMWTSPSLGVSASAALGSSAGGSVVGDAHHWPPALPPNPVSVSDMVENAFATAQEPVLGRLVLPSTSVSVTCPGMALQLPYRHKNSADLFKSSGLKRATRRLREAEEGGGEVSSTSPGGRRKDASAASAAAAAAAATTVTSPIAAAVNTPGGEQESQPQQAYNPSNVPYTQDVDELDGVGDDGSTALVYMFTVTVQNMTFNMDGEDFDLSLRGGTARRIHAHGNLDVFAYLSRASRRVLARHIMPTRVLFDPTHRRFTEEVAGVDALELELREIELSAMAKVWAYPEDMPIIMKGRKAQVGVAGVSGGAGAGFGEGGADGGTSRRTPSIGLDAASGLHQIMPELLKSPNQYPIPFLPYLKAGAVRANIVQRLTATPNEPGGAVLAAAATVFGLQAWVSPLHVWHLMSLEVTVRNILKFLLGSSFVENVVAERKAEAAAAQPLPQLPAPRPHRRLLFSLDIMEVSLLWLIGTWTSKGKTSSATDASSRYSRAWGITVKKSDPAYLWAQWLAPVYGVSLARIEGAAKFHPNGTIVAGASVDGMIVRDLQLPDGAKHAYVLRPLPARARRLNNWVQSIRRYLLGVTPISPARMMWNVALRKIILRRRTSLAHTNALLENPELANEGTPSKSVVLGPQLAIWYRSTPSTSPVSTAATAAATGPPKPQAELRIEVGQMLAYVRIKQQASMTAFAQQLSQIATMITSDTSNTSQNAAAGSGGGRGDTRGGKSSQSGDDGPHLQSGLRVDVILVGIDVLFRVESRDLMALKLQQGVITVDRKAVTTKSGPKDIRLHISASVQDIMIQDMRAAPEHTLVLIPNANADYCSFDAIYTAQVDSRRFAPCLILEMKNPRIMILFRFVADIMNAVDIIQGAVAGKKTPAEQDGTGTAAAPAEAAATAPAVQQGPSPATNGAKPLEIVVQLHNAGLIIPTGTTTRTVLAANLDHAMLAVPGKALPATLLGEAELPSLDSIVEESLLCNVTYKYGGFRDGAAATATGGEAGPPGSAAAAAAANVATAEGGVAQAAAPDYINTIPAGASPLSPLGGDDTTDARVIKRSGFFNRVQKDRAGGGGVLFFEEDDTNGRSTNQAGVLHVSLSGRDRQPSGHLVDNVLAGPASVARQIGTATRQLAEDIVDVFESDVTELHNLGGAHVVMQHNTGGRPESRESTAGGSAGGGKTAGGARPAVPLASGDADSGGAGSGAGGGVLEKLPDPTIALVIEEFTIVTGTLVRVPGYFRQAGSPNPRQGSFVPASLVSFSWPSQVYEVVPRSGFLQRANLCMIMFDRQYSAPATSAGAASSMVETTQLHISTTPLTFIMSGPNYTTLMDFISGNLRDLLDRGEDPAAPAMPAASKETKFNPSMKFGPPTGMAPKFRFTLAVPRLGVVLEAHPREWDDLHPEFDWVPASETHLLKPFFHGTISNLLMDLGTLPNGDMHINFCATSLDMQDLRMGYRLAEVSAKVPQNDGGVNVDGAAAAAGVEEQQYRPLQRWGAVKVSDEENRARAEMFLSTLSPEESPSVYASPAESPRSNSSFESAAADLPVTPTGAHATLQGPGLNFNLSNINVDTPETPVVFGSGASTNAQFGAGGNGGGAAGGAAVAGVLPDTVQKAGQQTGIRLSVSRRLSEHSHYRHRAGFVSDGSATPGSAGGASGGGGTPKHFLPVLDFGELPEVEHTLGEDVASLRILSAPHQAPPEERAASTVSTKLPGSNPNVRLEVSLAMLADDTVAVEIAMSSGLLQWPYFQDLSLISSIANVFKSATADEREAAGDDVPSVPFHPPVPGPSSWLYLNVILTEMEFFLPVLDVEMAERMAAEVWGDGIAGLGAAAGGGGGGGGMPDFFTAGAPGGNATTSGSVPHHQQRNSFQRIADLALAAMLLDSTSAPGALALEERGLALSATALRFGYAAGGDGNMVMRIDLRELAAFIRDPIARANCVLQPFSCSAEINSQVPEAAEHLEMERLDRAATLIQRQWRRYSARQALRTRIENQAQGVIPAVANFLVGNTRRSINGRGASSVSQHDDEYRRSVQWRLVDELVMDVASPHTRSLLDSYRRASRDRSQLMFLSQFLTVSTTVVHIKAGALTARAAFSHIPFWQTALDGVNRVVLGITSSSPSAGAVVVANPALTAPSSVGRGGAPAPLPSQPSLNRSNTDISTSKTELNPFRPHSLQVTIALENVAAVLCNDKPETFGAPDVLQLSFCEATLAYDAATMLPDRPANKAARLALSTYASYLNSGTSRWEPLYDLWPINAEFVDIKSPMYLSDRKLNLWLSSDRHLNATFNPASLMSLGDALAFMRAFQDQDLSSSIDDEVVTSAAMAQQNSASAGRSASGNLTGLDSIDGRKGASATTVSTKGAVTSRAPQKYLIQNQSGMRVYYWASTSTSSSGGGKEATVSTGARSKNAVFTLDNGSSETLRVSPVTKHVNFLHSTSTATGVERIASVIDLHFEGNWMPIRDVAVNVVGKYRYSMNSPADNTFVPLVVDIILVGRTKIITLHSGIWVENSIGRPVSLRLHVPTTPLVPPQAVGSGASAGGGVGGTPGVVGMYPHVSIEGDLSIGPLSPKAGCYLPLTAALGGRLFLQPEGYMEASRDVIRLSPDVEKLVGQQGYVSCDPLEAAVFGRNKRGGHPTAQAAIFYNDGDGHGPLHVAMEATPSRVVSEFQAFKHMECITPGTIQRATTPLEVTISIQPTMVISNALPYEMRVLLWQVPPPETPASPSVADLKASEKMKKNMLKKGPLAAMSTAPNKQNISRPTPVGSSALPAVTPGTAHHATLLEMLSPRTAPTVPVPRRGNPGQYYCYSIPPGGEQEVHVDMRQNVLMHVSVEEINMRSIKWSLCSWAQRPGRRDGRETQQYAAKLPKEVQLRLVSVGMGLPMDHSLISPYLLRLKDAGTMLGTMHRQFHKEARTAVNSEDVQAAVGRVKAFAKRMGKAGTNRVQHALGRNGSSSRDSAELGSSSRRPVPPRAKPPAMAPPPVDGGVPKKRKSWMLARWSRRMDELTLPNEAGATSTAPAAARPDSAESAATTTASTVSPNKQLLSTAKPLSDASTSSHPDPKAVEMVFQSPTVAGPTAASAATAAAAAAPPRMPPRPPPLEITEAPLDEFRGPPTGMVPTPFDVWNQPPAPALKKTESKFVESDDEEYLGTEVRAPPILHVGVHNSLVDQKLEQAGVCRITLYSPYWLNNRTGIDLFYQDHTSAPTYPLLCGAKLPGDFGEVFVPGTSMTELFDTEGSETGASAATTTTAGGGGGAGGLSKSSSYAQLGGAGVGVSKLGVESEHHQALLEYKLVLMNKQESLGLGLGHVKRRKYGSPVPIKTVGNKGSVELRGPAAVAPPSTAEKVAQGLKGAAEAVATAGTAVPAAAVNRLQQGLRPGGTPEKKPGYPTSTTTGADVVSTEPGTMLVRLSSATPSRDRTLNRRTSSLRTTVSIGEHTSPKPVDDQDALQAFEAMQQVPSIIPTTAPSGGSGNLDDVGGRGGGLPSVLPTTKNGRVADDAIFKAEDAVVSTELQGEGISAGRTPQLDTRNRLLQPLEGDAAEHAQENVEEQVQGKRTVKVSKGQRLFEFAVDVAAAPPDSIYSHTKLVTLKPKYIIENQTGLPVDVKQLETKNPEDYDEENGGGAVNSGEIPSESARFARTLAPGQRAAVYWDDADLPRELVVRPCPPGDAPGTWHWSGGFPIPDTEWYFGLRIRRAQGERSYMNIPVNVTVGSSGSVQVTLKSPASVPPYRIENACKDVHLFFVQVPMVFREQGNLYVDSLQPGESMPYAWDEPTLVTKLRVQAKVVGRESEGKVSDFVLDRLGDAPMMMLPTHGDQEAAKRTDKAGRIYRTLSNDVPDELKKKLVSLLAAEFSKKVYVSVYADGPTRVLRFSDEKNTSSLEQQHVVLDLAARLKQVESQLRAVNAQFARLSGVSGSHSWSLDLYGRMPNPKDEAQSRKATLQRRTSRKAPLPEATQALVHYASRHLPAVTAVPRHGRNVSRDFMESPSGSTALAPSGGAPAAPSGVLAVPATAPVPAKEKSGVRFARSVSFADDPTAAGPSRTGPGVLQVQDDEYEPVNDGTGNGTALPYRHLSIHPDTDLGKPSDTSLVPTSTTAVLQTPSPAGNYFLGDGSKAPVDDGASGSGTRLRRGESRDWGHIMTDPQQGAAGTRGLGQKSGIASASTGSLAIGLQGGSTVSLPGLSANASAANLAAATLARRQELLRLMVDGDAVLLVGGDLTVTVVQAKDLAGIPRSTHPFARIRVQDPVPPPDADERTKQTSVVWQSADPVWDEQLLFRDVCAASELVVELWDLGGTRSSDQLNALSTNPQEVIKSCRYLGRAEIPLGDTLDAPPGTPLWFPLMRRSAADTVSGQLQLRFQWDVTARGLLAIKLAALERVLAQRREILAALHPVQVRTALDWTEPATADASAAANAAVSGQPSSPTKAAASNNAEGAPQGVDLFGLGGEANIGGITSINQPSKVAAEVLARHSLDHSQRHLVVTVLEARGLNPRRGVVVALSASELPNPVVTLTVPGHPAYSTPTMSHTLAPRWPADGRHCFKGVDPASAAVHIRVWDQRRSGMTQRGVTLGQGVIHASHVRGDKPVYVWVPMSRPGKGRSSALPTAPGELDSELQVFLRLQWQTEVERGSSFKMEIDAAGAGLMVVGGLQDELFNLTVDSAKVSAVRTRLELQVEGSIAKVQLDNQMLNAVEPVVLAPDVGVKPAGAAVDGPLLSFEFVRSYAGSAGRGNGTSDVIQDAAAALAEASSNSMNNAAAEGVGDDASVSGTSASASANDLAVLGAEGRGGANNNNDSSRSLAPGGVNATTVSTSHSDARGIRSFKKIRFTVAPLDLMTDEAFLEALLSFISSLPTADIWQDRAWQEQQRRLLNAQFGPREVEGLAVNAVVVAPQAPPTALGITPGIAPGSEGLATVPTTTVVSGAGTNGTNGFISNHAAAATALSWVIEKEARDLEALHGQSDLSSWFFLESAEVGMISVNVTVSLTSRLIAAGQSLSRGGGTFNRALDASGFQLVNVSNVPITLGRWVAGNDPSIRGRFSNGFLSQRALASNLARHYYRQGLQEAHKVLGGAGPAVASVPLAVLWASGSALMLVREVSTGNAGFVGALQQSIYIPMMSLSLLGAGFSRTFAAGMAAMPPHRDDGDDETLRRIIRRPNNALEALAGAPKELVYGVANAFKGCLMDPVAGWHDLHIFGFTLGLFKAMLGLPVRPLIGGLEFSSKIFAAMALSSLGRDGIVGKIQRRVRAPGAYADDSGDAMMEDGPRNEAQAHTRTLQAAWQRVLPEFFPEMAGDTVTDVLNVRPTRVVLVTDKHVAYLRARHLREHSVYKAKWLVPLSEVQNIRGDPETRKITIIHVHKYDLKLLGVWPVQKRKGMRCGSRATYERTVLRLTKEQQALQSGGGAAGEGAAANGFVPANIEELTIVSAPYRPPARAAGSAQTLLLTGPRNSPPSGAAGGDRGIQQTGSQIARTAPAGMAGARGLPPPPIKMAS